MEVDKAQPYYWKTQTFNPGKMNRQMYAWQMHETGKEFKLVKKEFPKLTDEDALVKVSGCGVCHTDISFWHYGVKTKHELPLTLGHEISGQVIDGPTNLKGKYVVIPAVLPCGECELCKKDRSNICQNQLMPGNDFDGGFASHVKVPAKFLCEVPENMLKSFPLEHLAVIADAVSTPYQVIEKSELKAGDLAIIIGVGGIGIYGVQLATIKGAKVLALDINEEKLRMASSVGAAKALNTFGMDIREIKNLVRESAKELGVSRYGWKIFEMSGTKVGQELAFNLITYASTLSVVGFTMDKVEVRLSNLMAFDAKLIGTWGCKPAFYSDVLKLVNEGKLVLSNFVQTHPMSKINEVFKDTLAHKYSKRSVLLPDFE